MNCRRLTAALALAQSTRLLNASCAYSRTHAHAPRTHTLPSLRVLESASSSLYTAIAVDGRELLLLPHPHPHRHFTSHITSARFLDSSLLTTFQSLTHWMRQGTCCLTLTDPITTAVNSKNT
ncbi:hypothetical protein CC80DRAFT_87919 [Byssothecium circinans]|uniref:Secreted protein n=1 Tax=Byssothecium circinans TaxID=147558 RepID=A0A6A5TSK3_9PLEO|nr:hypothetical protein CC80DRAFT_87919 [Byssothecium circinans]